MRVIKTRGRRGPNDVMWSVGGVVRIVSLEEAVDLALEVHAIEMRQARQHNLWSTSV